MRIVLETHVENSGVVRLIIVKINIYSYCESALISICLT
jgi:hypothetical protein